MLLWRLQKHHILPVNQNLSSVYFSLAKFQLVSCNLSLAMIWQMTYTTRREWHNLLVHNRFSPSSKLSVALDGCLEEVTTMGELSLGQPQGGSTVVQYYMSLPGLHV